MTTTATISSEREISLSAWNALPHFLPIAVFPLIFSAAIYGGWWILAPFLFFMSVGPLDLAFGADGRNADPKTTPEHRLIWYNLSVWLWALLWPVTLVFTLWQIFMVGHLSVWEGALLALVLAIEGQGVFIVGHELIHRRSAWERHAGIFLLSSVSYPHYATEHFHIHHVWVGTPRDVGSAPRGQSFWQYFPRELASNLVGAWNVCRKRMANRQLPAWSFNNPFWVYGAQTLLWYTFVCWVGGWWAGLIFMVLCLGIVFSMKISNYIQHYGLRRIRLPNGRFERAGLRHSWGADYKFSNWMFFNMQRHPDHHVSAGRRYPLLQHHGADQSPQLPGSYGSMFGLALRPKRWFETMDPLVDQWRAYFYPQIKNWEAYDSPVSIARPEAFDEIVEIYNDAPHLVSAIEQNPELLDNLHDPEFTNLQIPDGISPDPEFELLARRGLARVYWTHEFGVAQMLEQIGEIPVQDAMDAAEIVRNWSNGKVFQISMHTVRGSLSPDEAGIALANVAQASITAVLNAAVEDDADRHWQSDEYQSNQSGGVAAIALGDLASREVKLDTSLEILVVYEDSPTRNHQALCVCFQDALVKLTDSNLLFEPLDTNRKDAAVYSIADLPQYTPPGEPPVARCIFTSGAPGISQKIDTHIGKWMSASA